MNPISPLKWLCLVCLDLLQITQSHPKPQNRRRVPWLLGTALLPSEAFMSERATVPWLGLLYKVPSLSLKVQIMVVVAVIVVVVTERCRDYTVFMGSLFGIV